MRRFLRHLRREGSRNRKKNTPPKLSRQCETGWILTWLLLQLFRLWLGVTEYLFRKPALLDEVIRIAIEDNTFRSDDLEFTFAARVNPILPILDFAQLSPPARDWPSIFLLPYGFVLRFGRGVPQRITECGCGLHNVFDARPTPDTKPRRRTQSSQG
jgi:hypothetical protein